MITAKEDTQGSRRRIPRRAWCMALAAGLAAPLCAQVDIATKPLFVTAGVEPNIMAAIDDSGSMDSEVLLPNNDGALWWHANDDSFVGRDASDNVAIGVMNYNRAGGASGTWKKYIYLFPNGTGGGNRVYKDASNDHFAIPPFPQYAFVRSPDYNGMYYDPAVDYEVWPDAGGFTFVPPAANAVKSDPVSGGDVMDLTTNRRSNANHEVFRLYPGMVLPEGTTYWDGNAWVTAGSDIVVAGNSDLDDPVGIEYYPATYYLRVSDDREYRVDDSTGGTVYGKCSAAEPSHYPFFERNPSTLKSLSPAGNPVDAIAYDGGCLVKYEIKDEGTSFPSGRTYAQEIQNFATWWGFYRKRHMATRGGIGKAFSPLSGIRVGGLTNNSRNLRGMYSLTSASERSDFFEYIYKIDGNSGGTPNRQTLKFMGEEFDTNSSVITESCQQNFALLFTDGFSNPDSTGVGNADGGMGEPFEDGYSNTIADVAAYYYNRNLRGSALDPDEVPVSPVCRQPNPPLTEDCRDDPHMVTYGVTLGARGSIYGVTHFELVDAHNNPPAWQNPTLTRNPVQVDDLYHAAVNSRGRMLNAQSAQELQEVLSAALLDIVDRSRTSATSSSTSAAILQQDTLLYSVEFRSDDWTGNVIAQEIDDEDGSIEALAWSAEDKLAARSTASRNLLTNDGSGGVTLKYASLSADQQKALDYAPGGTLDGKGAQRIDWLRGAAVAGMRQRLSGGDRRLMGDIVSSTPIFAETPNRGYALLPETFSPSAYGTFLATIQDRPSLLAVGANDGMLHGFDADTGEELFAYMPSELLAPAAGDDHAQINVLTDPKYEHRFFVDGTPTVGDILIGTDWKTVLIGSMGIGGRTVFALDVTDPEGVGTNDVLWEFTDPDLGYGVTDIQIVPMRNDRFAAVFGNGYNSDDHKAFLFIVDAEDGSLIAKIDTGVGTQTAPNGLGPVQITDWPEGNQIAQSVFAGDLQGNLWVFDVSSSNKSQWNTATLVFEARAADGSAQPITVAPRLAPNPRRSGELMVVFGTGSYFRGQDNVLTNAQVQSLYGIRYAAGTKNLDRSDLLEQSITFETTAMALGEARLVREVSSNLYSGNNANQEQNGWYMDLSYQNAALGERVISRATFPSGTVRERVRFTTMTPSDNPCAAGRSGFIFDLDLFTGGATEYSVFDINDDGIFTSADLIGDKLISGIGGGKGEELTVIRNKEGTGDFFYDGAGERVGDTEGAEGLASGDPVGRQSWLQLR